MKTSRHRRFGREHWQEHVKSFKESGFSQIKYARDHGLKHQTLSGWLQTARRIGGDVIGMSDLITPSLDEMIQ